MTTADPEQDRLKDIRQREQVATKGPWRVEVDAAGSRLICTGESYDSDNDGPLVWGYHVGGEIATSVPAHDSEFIAHARQDIPYLLDLLSTTTARAEALEKGWQPIDTAPKDGTPILVGDSTWIAACSSFRDGRWWTWHPTLVGTRPYDQAQARAVSPTYWRPLPNPPSGAEALAQENDALRKTKP